MAAPDIQGSGEFCCGVVGFRDVQDVHVVFHYGVPENVNFVAETAFVKGVVSIQCGGLEPIGINNITREGGVLDRKSTRLNSSHQCLSRMPSSA